LIVFIDADDILTPDSLENRYEYFKDNPKIDMVHGRAFRWRWNEKEKEWEPDGYRKNAVIHAQGIMIKREVFEKFGLFYEKLRSKADKEMTYRLGVHRDSPLPKLIKCKKIKNYVAYYRKHKDQMHKQRKANPKINNKIEKTFKQRIKQLKREGITKENTLWL